MKFLDAYFRPVVLVLLFFPSVLLLPLGQVEIFPYGILTLVFFRRVSLRAIPEFLLFVAVVYGVLVGIATQAPGGELLRSMAAYMNVLIPAIYLLSHQEARDYIEKKIPFIFWFLCSVGFIQFTGILPNSVEPIIQLIIPRFSAYLGVSEGSIGARLLSSEPARAGYEFVTISILYFWIRSRSGKGNFLHILIGIVMTLFIIRSATAAFVLIAAMIGFSPFRVSALLGLALLGVGSISGEFLGRGLVLIRELFASPDIFAAYLFLLDESGHRLISNIASYSSFLSNPWGYGIGQWQTSSVLTIEALGIPLSAVTTFSSGGGFSAVRTTSFFGPLILDAGLVALVAGLAFIFLRLPGVKGNPAYGALFGAFIVITGLVGDAGNPVPWVALSLMVSANSKLKFNAGAESRRATVQMVATRN
jgi:hypothetical protein